MLFTGLEPGFDIPALPGMSEAQIHTPCLVLDLDALEANITRMARHVATSGMALRVHCKMHKSVDVARLQMRLGGASGICCQKVSEAEVFARAGFEDILVTNQVRDPAKIDRLARLPLHGARVAVCVDDLANVAELSRAAVDAGTELDALVEIDCGGARCGVTTPEQVLAIARAIADAPGLRFDGVQSYHGPAQHLATHAERVAAIAAAGAQTRDIVAALTDAGLPPRLITGAGSASYPLESASGIWNELQCGSYAFMDADYGRVEAGDGQRLDRSEWRNALFLLTSIMSHPTPDRAVCDAGLKVQSVDSGLPIVHGRDDVTYTKCSDEHGVIHDPMGVLAINDRLRLIPGHCDPTCNLHDWYVGVRGGVVECVWPVSARGKTW